MQKGTLGQIYFRTSTFVIPNVMWVHLVRLVQMLAVGLHHSSQAGYYCVGSFDNKFKCNGPEEFCPADSGRPSRVSEGHYTVNVNEDVPYDETCRKNCRRDDQMICEKGYYCVGGLKYRCGDDGPLSYSCHGGAGCYCEWQGQVCIYISVAASH